ncbi:hypothetical protein HO173_008370 [Letharia columbiana]|uniref:Uncharacterized protein n=1 Tax=Letharia columbiana TaxID=112416 RepID=A0A8H6FRK7_9LECA|nr:uncharacterized protein HO173_008370 [Letharia columbiana]KAF6233438.1 hypothetical protein HO173_008370 [Letharia columbiana]
MSKSLRTLSVLTRPSSFSRPLTRSQHSLLRHNGDTTIQPVRFKSNLRRHSKRLFYQIAIVSAVSYYQLRYVDVEEEETVDKAGAPSKMQPEDGDKAKDGAREDGKVDEDDVQVPETMPEDAFFVPLGFVRQRPHTHYKASDPEWQSFVEFGRDRERPTAVRRELADTVCSSFAGHKVLQRQIGVPMKLGRVWLDIVYPDGPAPEYDRSGLEIADDYIAWTTRPVSALQVARLNSALKPLPAVKSLWASYSTYCSLQLARLKQFLNIGPTSSNTSPQLPVGAVTVDQLRENSSKQETQNRAQMDKMSDPKSDVGSTKGSAKLTSSDGSKIYGSLPSLLQPDSDIGPAIMEFKRTLAKNWHPPGAFGERGTFVVRGDVELKGPKGSCVFEVVADYHPQEARYKTVRAGLKYSLRNRVRPRPLPEPKKSSS